MITWHSTIQRKTMEMAIIFLSFFFSISLSLWYLSSLNKNTSKFYLIKYLISQSVNIRKTKIVRLGHIKFQFTLGTSVMLLLLFFLSLAVVNVHCCCSESRRLCRRSLCIKYKMRLFLYQSVCCRRQLVTEKISLFRLLKCPLSSCWNAHRCVRQCVCIGAVSSVLCVFIFHCLCVCDTVTYMRTARPNSRFLSHTLTLDWENMCDCSCYCQFNE